MGLFKKRSQLAVLNTILMISLSTTNPKEMPVLKFVMQQWNRYASTSQLNSLNYAGGFVDKGKKLVFYFSPYTFDCFLKYLRKLIDNGGTKGAIIPHSNGTRLSHIKATTRILENVPKRNRNGIASNKNGRMYVTKVNIRRTYDNPEVTYNDQHDYASFIIYNLLFFSYSRTARHDFDNPQAVYKDNVDIAKQFKSNYMSEYHYDHHDYPTKGSFAHVPDYRDFINGNRDSVYIPNLTTARQRKQSEKFHRDYNVNVFNMDDDTQESTSALKNAEKYKRMHYRNKLVTSMENKKTEEANERQEEKIERSEAEAKQQLASAKAWKAKINSIAQSNNDAKAEAEKGAKAGANVSDKSVASSSAQQAPKSRASVKSKSTQPSQVVSSKAPSASSSNNKSAITSQQSPKSSQQTKQVATQQKPKQQQVSNPASMNAPYIFTTDPDMLKVAVKAMMTKKAKKHDEAHLQRMHLLPMKVTDESPEVALKNGDLSDQEYVEAETNNFKHMANSFIRHYEYVLNLAEHRSELKIKNEAYSQLTHHLKEVVTKYTSDAPLEKNSVQYYRDLYKNALAKLNKQCDERLNKRHEALINEMHAKFSEFQDKVYTWYDQQQRKEATSLRSDVLKTYTKDHEKRNNEIKKRLRHTKEDAHHVLTNQLANHKIQFKHRASQASHILYQFFVRKLEQNKQQWLKTVKGMVQAQVKKEHAQAKAEHLALKVAQTKSGSKYNIQLRQELKQVRQYSDDASKQYDAERNRFLVTRDKLYKQADKNDELKDKIEDLRNQISTNSSSAKRTEESNRQATKHLRHLLQQREQRVQKLSQSLVAVNGDKAQYSTNLDDIKSQLTTSKMEANGYKKMLEKQRMQNYHNSQQDAQLRQKYWALKDAMNKNNITMSEASHRASLAQARTSASVASSVARSFSNSIQNDNINNKSAIQSIKDSYYADASLASSKADSVKSEAQWAKASLASQRRMRQQDKERWSAEKSIMKDSVSMSAQEAQTSAAQKARSEANEQVDSRIAEERSIAQSQASTSASLKARAVQRSANAKMSYAKSLQDSLQAQQISELKARAKQSHMASLASARARRTSLAEQKAMSQARASSATAHAHSLARQRASRARSANSVAQSRQAKIIAQIKTAKAREARAKAKIAKIENRAKQARQSASQASMRASKQRQASSASAQSTLTKSKVQKLKNSLSRSLEIKAKQSIAQDQRAMQRSAERRQQLQAQQARATNASNYQYQPQQPQQPVQQAPQQTPVVNNTQANINNNSKGKSAIERVKQIDAQNKLQQKMTKINAKANLKKQRHRKGHTWFQW